MATSIRKNRPQARRTSTHRASWPSVSKASASTNSANHKLKTLRETLCTKHVQFISCHYSLNNTGYKNLQGIYVVSGVRSEKRMHISYMAITWHMILYERPEHLQMWASWAEGGVLDPIPVGTKQWLHISIPGRYSCTILPKIYQTSPKSSL